MFRIQLVPSCSAAKQRDTGETSLLECSTEPRIDDCLDKLLFVLRLVADGFQQSKVAADFQKAFRHREGPHTILATFDIYLDQLRRRWASGCDKIIQRDRRHFYDLTRRYDRALSVCANTTL